MIVNILNRYINKAQKSMAKYEAMEDLDNWEKYLEQKVLLERILREYRDGRNK